MVAWVYILKYLTLGVKIKSRNIWGYARGFYSMRTVFVACTLQLVHLPSFQSLDPYLLKILDVRMPLQEQISAIALLKCLLYLTNN